jgi:hypothetical protein
MVLNSVRIGHEKGGVQLGIKKVNRPHKFSDCPFKSCDESILRLLEVKSESPSALIGIKIGQEQESCQDRCKIGSADCL